MKTRNINELKRDIVNILANSKSLKISDIVEKLGYKRTGYGYVWNALKILKNEGKVFSTNKTRPTLWSIVDIFEDEVPAEVAKWKQISLTCQICYREFDKLTSLRNHARTHREERLKFAKKLDGLATIIEDIIDDELGDHICSYSTFLKIKKEINKLRGGDE